jgi:hypothetical protein
VEHRDMKQRLQRLDEVSCCIKRLPDQSHALTALLAELASWQCKQLVVHIKHLRQPFIHARLLPYQLQASTATARCVAAAGASALPAASQPAVRTAKGGRSGRCTASTGRSTGCGCTLRRCGSSSSSSKQF